jgi:hypothetical protein
MCRRQCWTLILLAVGPSSCASPRTTGACFPKGHPSQPPVSDVIARIKARYLSFRSYNDEGEAVVVASSVVPASYARFRTHYARSGLNFDYRSMVLISGAPLTSDYRIVLDADDHGKVTIRSTSSEDLHPQSLGRAAGILAGPSMGVTRVAPALLAGGPDFTDALASVAMAQTLRSEVVGDVTCLRIEMPPRIGDISFTVWVDDHYLVRRMVETSDISTIVISYQHIDYTE